jgi:Uma2 family endonuclease
MTTKTAISLDDLMDMEGRVEILNGEVIEMAGGGVEHSRTGYNIMKHIGAYVDQYEIGLVLGADVTYLMFSDPASLLDSFMPDVSFIRAENYLSYLPEWNQKNLFPVFLIWLSKLPHPTTGWG